MEFGAHESVLVTDVSLIQGIRIGYIPQCRVMLDLHNQGPKAPRLCKSSITLHQGM